MRFPGQMLEVNHIEESLLWTSMLLESVANLISLHICHSIIKIIVAVKDMVSPDGVN